MIDNTLTVRELMDALESGLAAGIVGPETPVFCKFPGATELCKVNATRPRALQHPNARSSHGNALVLQGAPCDFYIE